MGRQKATVLLLVVDAVGAETLDFLLDHHPGKLKLPNFSRLGLGRIVAPRHRGRLGRDGRKTCAMRLCQASASADSVIGHREMVGIVDPSTYELFPNGFRRDFIAALESRIGRKTIFNKMAGGMEAIELNAAEHEKTGRPIVYASKCDPLVQIAMNEAVIPVKEQHKIADLAFELAKEMDIPVTRVIARAYVRSTDGEIVRTANRHDTVLPMSGKTLVDLLYARDVWTAAVGKTSDLVNTAYHERIKLTKPAFLNPGLRLRFMHPKKKDTNPYTIQGTVNALSEAAAVYRPNGTFVFTNLVDADSLYGHTRDVAGAIRCLEGVDAALPLFEGRLRKGDLMIITADHGMQHREDYGYHNKEELPLIVERIGSGADLGGIKVGPGQSLCEVGHIVAQALGCAKDYEAECDFKAAGFGKNRIRG
jgi:phosphopentomutase